MVYIDINSPLGKQLKKLFYEKLEKQRAMINKDVAEKKRCCTCHKKFRKGDIEKNWCSWCSEQIEVD